MARLNVSSKYGHRATAHCVYIIIITISGATASLWSMKYGFSVFIFQFTNNEPELSCIGIVATIEFQFQFPSKQVMKSPATGGDFILDEH